MNRVYLFFDSAMTEFDSLSSLSPEQTDSPASPGIRNSMRFRDIVRMGSAEEGEEEARVLNVDETIFVAVGKDVKQSETTLLWAVKNFAGKNICLLHVHKPSRVLSLCEFLTLNVDFQSMSFGLCSVRA